MLAADCWMVVAAAPVGGVRWLRALLLLRAWWTRFFVGVMAAPRPHPGHHEASWRLLCGAPPPRRRRRGAALPAGWYPPLPAAAPWRACCARWWWWSVCLLLVTTVNARRWRMMPGMIRIGCSLAAAALLLLLLAGAAAGVVVVGGRSASQEATSGHS